jgi:hypothetical protein
MSVAAFHSSVALVSTATASGPEFRKYSIGSRHARYFATSCIFARGEIRWPFRS